MVRIIQCRKGLESGTAGKRKRRKRDWKDDFGSSKWVRTQQILYLLSVACMEELIRLSLAVGWVCVGLRIEIWVLNRIEDLMAMRSGKVNYWLGRWYHFMYVFYERNIKLLYYAIIEEYFKTALTVVFGIYGIYDYEKHGVYRSEYLFSPCVYYAIFETVFFVIAALRKAKRPSFKHFITYCLLRLPAIYGHVIAFGVHDISVKG